MSQPLRAIIHPMRPTEVGFCLSGWKKSLRHAPGNASQSAGSVYDRLNRDVDALLSRKTTKILVSVDETDPKFCLGFVVYEPSDTRIVVHFLYVRHGFRRFGYGGALLNEALQDSPEADDLCFTASTRFDDVAKRLGFRPTNIKEFLR